MHRTDNGLIRHLRRLIFWMPSLLTGSILLCLPVSSYGQLEEAKKQPPPEFSSGYAPPLPSTPLPRAELFAYLDALILVTALSLAAYIVLTKRSRSALRVLTLFSLLYFGFYRQGCVCAVGAIQNVSLALFQNGYALPFVVGVFFLLPLLFALFFGRVFCSSVCPLGTIQEIILLRPKRVPLPLDHALSLLPYLYLGAGVLFAATGTAFILCQYDPFIVFYRLGGNPGVVVFGAVLLLLGMFIGRPYCRYLCPYGVLLRWMAPFARWKVKITPAECVQCHLCADSCPYGAIKLPTPPEQTEDRLIGRRRLASLLLLLPILVVGMAGLGYLSSPALSRMNKTTVLAERVWKEERGLVTGTTEASQAFYNLGRSSESLYREASRVRRRFHIGAALFGGWCGLVIGMKLIFLSLRRTQRDYEADPASCLSCARCYSACPVEQERLGKFNHGGKRIELEPRHR